MPAGQRALAVALVLLSGWAVVSLLKARPGRLDRVAAVLLAAGALWWLFDSPAYEGPGIVALSSSDGLTVADLGVPPALFLSAGVLVKEWLTRRR